MIQNFLIAIDQLLNTLIYIRGEGFGCPDETMSARAWRLRGSSSTYKIINLLFFWQYNHCKEAWESEIYRRQYPKAYW